MNGDFRRIAKALIKPLLNWFQNFGRTIREISWLSRRNGQVERYYLTQGNKKLNIGCGANLLNGWLNADFNPGTLDVLFLDASQRFPLKDCSFDYVFSEHMIEHIPYDQGLQMLRECYRVLKPGGRLRIETPDLTKMIGLFSTEKSKEHMSYIDWSIGKFSHSDEVRVFHECFVLNRMVREWGHQFIYDAWTLSHAMSAVGFKNCRQLAVGNSEDLQFMNIEGHNDISGVAMNAYETLVIEAEK